MKNASLRHTENFTPAAKCVKLPEINRPVGLTGLLYQGITLYNMNFDIAEIVHKILIMYPALLIALVLHEYAHAWMAKRYGDMTAGWSGRLTLNPSAHMEMFGTVVFPILGIAFGGFIFGWAKPVPIDPRNFTSFRKGLFWVAFAGPLSNIILGFLFGIIYVAFFVLVDKNFYLYTVIRDMLQAFVFLNFVLAIFNLLPIPPLDGSKMVESFLSYENMRKFESIQQYGFFILIVLLFTGVIQMLLYPVNILANWAFTLGAIILTLFGVNVA